MAKAVAAGAVLVAAALPVALAGTAGAATAATLTCSNAPTLACSNQYAIIGQGYTGNIFIAGTGFANDQAVGGNVTITTTAPGVTFSNVVETATTVQATVSSSASTTPGFYPITVTDTNGAATLALGLGVDHGPTTTAVTGNAGTVGVGTSTVTITGSHLHGASISFNGALGAPGVSTVVNTSDTTLTFVANNVGAVAGTYAFTITAPYPASGAFGKASGSYTVNAAATPITISAVTPNELGIPVSGTSTVPVTVSGTGFEPGAVLSIPAGFPAEVSFVSSTYVNSTTMILTLNVASAPTTTGQVAIKVLNPDSTTLTGANLIGIGTPALATIAGATPPVAPVILTTSGQLTPGTSSVITVQGSSTFIMTTGSTVTATGDGHTYTGTVLSVDATTNTARLNIIVPRFGNTTLTAATTGASTSLALASVAGLPASGTVTIVDGASTQNVNYSAISGSSLTIVAGAAGVHAAGAVVEFTLPSATFTVSVGNGTYTESTTVAFNAQNLTAYSVLPSGTTLPAGLVPGTYTVNAYVPGFGFTTGASVIFGNTAPLVLNGITGTVAVVNGNIATLTVTVPANATSVNSYTLGANATPGQNALTLNTTVGLNVGDKITVNADAFYLVPETFTISAIVSGTVVSISAPVANNHTSGATVSDLSSPQATSGTISAVILNGAGEGVTIANFFGLTTNGTATPSLSPVGAGASAATETFTLSTPTTDTTAANWTVSSTTAGVTFGAVTGTPGATIVVPISVAAGTAPNASVPVKLSDGLTTYTGTLATVVGPTITSVTAVGTLTAGGTETIGVTGTNFSVGNMACSVSDPAVICTVVSQLTDSATTMTVNLSATTPFAGLNGADTLTVTNTVTKGAGSLSAAVNIAGQPTVTAVSPTVVSQGLNPAITVTGTAFPADIAFCAVAATDVAGNPDGGGTGGCTVTFVSATSVTITGYPTGGAAGDTLVFTIGDANVRVSTPAVTVQANPTPSFIEFGTNVFYFQVVSGSANVPFKLVGANFLPGTTLSIPATAGTITVTEVTPNAIFGTISLIGETLVAPQSVTVTATNTNGGTGVTTFSETQAPFVTGTYTGLSGKATSLVITGGHFYAGTVVTANVPAFATFGTAVTSNGAAVCTVDCTTITVPVTWVVNAGATPIMSGLTITNPTGQGAVTVANDLVVSPGPAVTGTYYVPTFSTNVLVVISGTGFQTGMTETSTNSPAYTVGLVGVTNTTATLLVSTSSAATTGTSSTITFTNPDGGTTSFPLNGGPNPALSTPVPHAIRCVGVAHLGRTSTIQIVGTHFYGQPKITSNNPGTTVRVSGDNGKVLRVLVKTGAHSKRGVHTMVIRFANGEQTHVKYNTLK